MKNSYFSCQRKQCYPKRKVFFNRNSPYKTRAKIKFTKTDLAHIPINKAAYNFGAIKENARIRVEEDTDPVFRAIKQKLICQENNKHILKTEPKAKRSLVHEDKLAVKHGTLMRKYYRECGQMTHQQI